MTRFGKADSRLTNVVAAIAAITRSLWGETAADRVKSQPTLAMHKAAYISLMAVINLNGYRSVEEVCIEIESRVGEKAAERLLNYLGLSEPRPTKVSAVN